MVLAYEDIIHIYRTVYLLSLSSKDILGKELYWCLLCSVGEFEGMQLLVHLETYYAVQF